MTTAFDLALQRALSIRLNLQIGLSALPMVEEWMDIHLDRWLEHVPMPPEMPDGHTINYLAMIGSDARRVWWGAWGDPRGFVPKMADYFKLCNIAKSDAQVLDQVGDALEPELVGSWIGVWGGKVTTGWHIWGAKPWDKIEAMFGTHEAKFQLKKWVTDTGMTNVERFTQAIGDNSWSELELRVPGDTVEAQVGAIDKAFVHFTGQPLPPPLLDRMREASVPELSITARIRGGKVIKFGGMVPGIPVPGIERFCADARINYDPNVAKVCGALAGDTIARLEFGRAGEHAGIDVFVEPNEAAAKDGAGKRAEPPSPSSVN
jgi:hypothetical protein